MRTNSFLIIFDSLTKLPDLEMIYGETYNHVLLISQKNMTEKTLTGIDFYMSISQAGSANELLEIEGDKTGSRVGFEIDSSLLPAGGVYSYQIRANNGDDSNIAYGKIRLTNRIE